MHTHTHAHTPQTADEEVTSGKMNILISGGPFPFQQDMDLCEIMKDYDLSCPVKSGKFSFGLTMNIPEILSAVSGFSDNQL